MIALDTNLLVRLLTNDEPRQAARVERWLHEHASANAPAYIDHIVLCELAWVLDSAYSYPRVDVHRAISALLDHSLLKVESSDRVREALSLYVDGPADFSDYLLAIRALAAGCSSVLTLDRKAGRSPTHSLLR